MDRQKDGQKDGQKDKHTLFYRTLLAKARGQIYLGTPFNENNCGKQIITVLLSVDGKGYTRGDLEYSSVIINKNVLLE